MEEEYKLKLGKLYIERIETNEYNGNTHFVDVIRLTSDPDDAMTFYGYENACESALIIEKLISNEIEVIER